MGWWSAMTIRVLIGLLASLHARLSPTWPAYAAAAWSAGYAVLGLLWALGAGGFPFGLGDPEAADMTSLLVGIRPETAGPIIAGLGATGAVAGLEIGRRAGAHPLLRVFAWAACGVLVFLVPHVRLLRDFAYASMLHFDKVDWPAINQLLCVAGGLLWGATAASLRRRPAPTRAWGRRATLAAIVLPVPYEVVRWAWALGIPLGVSRGAETIEHAATQERVGMFVLGLLPLLGGILTHGLVRPWGEVYPRWVPGKAGRSIAPAVAVIPGAAASILIITAGLVIYRDRINTLAGRVPEPHPDIEGWGAWLPAWFWLPWGIALAVATHAYWHRRRSIDSVNELLDTVNDMATAEQIEQVRDFNRFYTRRLGLTRNGYANRSLAEARVIYELGANHVTEVQELRARLDIDAGQLSRVLARLDGLVERAPSPDDARRQRVALTSEGRRTYQEIDAESAREIATTLDTLPDADAVITRMRALRQAIEPDDRVLIRGLEPGDLGWLVERHGVLYAREYGWDGSFERLVAGIAAEFDPGTDRAFIAEHNGERAGMVLCVHQDARTAKLRTLLVEPGARGLGLGTRLVREVIKHARRRGYATLTLWTNDVLHAAGRIYEREGFRLTSENRHHAFGHDLTEQTWSLTLNAWTETR
jgi:DNA-binding MarR family transcriptional regulator/N-acetylglutamate synthase-like GNAT family acetyltransferase